MECPEWNTEISIVLIMYYNHVLVILESVHPAMYHAHHIKFPVISLNPSEFWAIVGRKGLGSFERSSFVIPLRSL